MNPKNLQSAKAPLPAQPVVALQRLIRISQNLMALAEKETQALLTDDMLSFAIMQYEKEKIAEEYSQASENFRNRLEEFRKTDPHLLGRLEKLQRDLQEKMKNNNVIVDRIRERAQFNAQKNIIKANDPGTARRIRFSNPSTSLHATATE